ncbi:ricin B lectin domain-containing protein [Crassisporium funariophilum]|nr:ricin B lectin domain-containing protein [Crassisporium funariophilum]
MLLTLLALNLLAVLPTVLAVRQFTILNRCPQPIALYINGQTQGTLEANTGTNRTFEDTWSGLIYTTANAGNANGAGTTRAGFYGETNYYYIVKDPNHLNTGVSILPQVISAQAAAFCSVDTCDSAACPNAYSQQPTAFPAPTGTPPSPPLYECPGTSVGYTVTFCPSRTFPPPDGYVAIHPAGHPEKCLDVRGAAFGNGTPVQIYDCNGTAAQRWTIARGVDVRVALAGTGYCLDTGTGKPSSGTGMKIWQCLNYPPQQVFNYTPENQIKLVSANQCLDLTKGSLNNGNSVQTWTCQSNNTNQFWITS